MQVIKGSLYYLTSVQIVKNVNLYLIYLILLLYQLYIDCNTTNILFILNSTFINLLEFTLRINKFLNVLRLYTKLIEFRDIL